MGISQGGQGCNLMLWASVASGCRQPGLDHSVTALFSSLPLGHLVLAEDRTLGKQDSGWLFWFPRTEVGEGPRSTPESWGAATGPENVPHARL